MAFDGSRIPVLYFLYTRDAFTKLSDAFKSSIHSLQSPSLTIQHGVYLPPINSGLYALTPPAFISSLSAIVAY
jgi:hypothetical protein